MGFWESDKQKKQNKSENASLKAKLKDGAQIQFEKGLMNIKLLTEDMFKVTFTKTGKFLNVPSFAVINEKSLEKFTLEDNEENIVIGTDKLMIAVRKADGAISVTNSSGRLIYKSKEEGFCWNRDTIKCNIDMDQNNHFYGLGEKTGFLDKKGRKYVMWNTDEPLHTPTKDPLYKSIPFLINFDGQESYGILVDNPGRTWFDLREDNDNFYSFEVDDEEINFYFIYGGKLKDVVSKYSDITGRMTMPPMWSLGYQQCRWSYYPESTIKKLAGDFREKNIPCDVIYLDIDYMDGYRVFTWDENGFPDPERMLTELREQGFKVVTIVDPGVKKDAEYDVYMDGLKKDVYCKEPEGNIYHGEVWPGVAAYPDFTKEKTQEWWAEKHKALIGKGIAGIWNDMNEPSDFSVDSSQDRTLATVPDHVMMDNNGNPRSFRRYHNIYGFSMCKGTRKAFENLKPEERPFIVTRSAYAGIQRYSAVWTGDNTSWWEHLESAIPMHMNIGMSGVPFVGGDVGGFQGDATGELFARWIQLGAFTPFFRGHSAIYTIQQEPWAFNEKVEAISKKYIDLRYKLLPYNYNEFYKASTTGIPIMRPLVLEYEADKEVYNLNDEFLYGENILVAPVTRPSVTKKCVYLPKGCWFNYWTEEYIEGGKYVLVDAPMDVLPMFVKGGSIIPNAEVVNYVGEKKQDKLTLDIYLGLDGKYSLYEDDGVSNEYKDGVYSMTEFSVKTENNKINICIKPVTSAYDTGRKVYGIVIHGVLKKPVSINGEEIILYNESKKTLSFSVEDLKAKQDIVVQF
ncbi:glycoside hydrolase family 31 protein [Clostridium oryzae]|uniref:Alpha-xylosidase n=1 Tax=Clostridium oryzae TaxID=1450648 RepID=A0A1V4IQ28_9CLOT|nr:glycoside hydrolase family 31 protein [Clostridium oryzae]OPJ62122.1 alpha-xylosidase [Clostridium oryzae]